MIQQYKFFIESASLENESINMVMHNISFIKFANESWLNDVCYYFLNKTKNAKQIQNQLNIKTQENEKNLAKVIDLETGCLRVNEINNKV